MKIQTNIVFIFMLTVFIFSSCKNEKIIKKTKATEEKTEVEYKNEIQEINIYKRTDSLLERQFGKKIKSIDFKENSLKKPHHFELFNRGGLKNIRGYLDPTFNKSYISQQFENYTLFIFEYIDISFAEKAFMQFNKDNKRILELIENDEWFNPNKTIKKDTRTKRALKMSGHCKSGGMVFEDGKYIFSIVKTCREPLTIKKMKWKEYENIFLELYLNKLTHKKLILNAGCGDRNYEKEFYNEKE